MRERERQREKGGREREKSKWKFIFPCHKSEWIHANNNISISVKKNYAVRWNKLRQCLDYQLDTNHQWVVLGECSALSGIFHLDDINCQAIFFLLNFLLPNWDQFTLVCLSTSMSNWMALINFLAHMTCRWLDEFFFQLFFSFATGKYFSWMSSKLWCRLGTPECCCVYASVVAMKICSTISRVSLSLHLFCVPTELNKCFFLESAFSGSLCDILCITFANVLQLSRLELEKF